MTGPLSPELLGGYREPEPSVYWLGVGVFALALCVTGIIERIQFRLRFLEARTWWASNGRDVLNSLAFGAMAGALAIFGFRGPVALVIAASIILLVNTVQSSLGTRRGGTVLSALASLALGVPVLLLPSLVDQGLRSLLLFLF
ncbi:MAG: hypothetical protein WBV82_03510 [Myxococcaceae bacterium]